VRLPSRSSRAVEICQESAVPTPSSKSNAPRQDRKAKLAAAREHARLEREARMRKQRRNRILLQVGIPVVVVLLVVAVFAVIKLTKGSSSATPAPANGDAASLTQQIAALPASVFDQVGAGASSTPPTAVSGDAMTADGKPRVLYIGAEYCPYCAAERWPLVVALSRFGTFSGLGTTTSGAKDVYPSTPTLTFQNATYTSQYLSFTGVETKTNQLNAAGTDYTALQTPTAADTALMGKYDTGGSIPFLDIANKYTVIGSAFVPDKLAGSTQQQIVQNLSDPSNAATQQIIGSANVLTAALCEQTGNQPAAVCGSAGAKAGATVLAAK
jgi:hypothetical protein